MIKNNPPFNRDHLNMSNLSHFSMSTSFVMSWEALTSKFFLLFHIGSY